MLLVKYFSIFSNIDKYIHKYWLLSRTFLTQTLRWGVPIPPSLRGGGGLPLPALLLSGPLKK